MPKKIKGFTLIELLVTVSITAVITAAAMVSVSGLNGKKLEAEAMKMIGDIAFARERAAALHRPHAIHFDAINREYSIYNSPSQTSADFIPANFLKKVATESSLSVSGTAADIWFLYPDGRATSGLTQITLTLNGRSSQVRIFPQTGYARSG